MASVAPIALMVHPGAVEHRHRLEDVLVLFQLLHRPQCPGALSPNYNDFRAVKGLLSGL